MASNDSERTGSAHGQRVADERPLIGLTSYLEPSRHGVWDVVSALLPAVYPEAVTRAGGRPVLLPPLGGWTAAEVADLDGLILTGGSDVDPARYGEQPHPRTAPPHPRRDAAEIELIASARSAGVPILGICRGLQVLNVAFGGSLHQHLPDVVGHARHQVSPAVFHDTTVSIAPDSDLADVLGDRADVRCYHHQAVARVGIGLRVVATAPDGVVEAIEAVPDSSAESVAGWVLAVQWHPEENLNDLRLFGALVGAAQARRSERSAAHALARSA